MPSAAFSYIAPISPIASQIKFLTFPEGSFDKSSKIDYLKKVLVSGESFIHKLENDY